MVAIENSQIPWQTGFVAILPEIEQRLRRAFRRLDPESRDEAIEDGVVHCLLAYRRLDERGRLHTASPSSLVWYATLQVRKGRIAGCPMNAHEPLSRYAQFAKGIKIQPLQTYSKVDDQWIDSIIIEDRKSSPADQAVARMDIRTWLATLSDRMRQIAKDLAFGFSTAEVSSRQSLSASRISQIRRILKQSWDAFRTRATRSDTAEDG